MSALVIVDVQNDFISGSLPVPNGSEVIPKINELIKSRRWDIIIATKDWHPKDHCSFSSTHKGVKEHTLHSDNKKFNLPLWPDHCVQDTYGAELVDGLDTKSIDRVVLKGTMKETEFYSAVSDVFQNHETDLVSVLNSYSIGQVCVVGLAFDYCVMYTAMDLQRHNFKTSIKKDCTRSITPEGESNSLKRLEEQGVTIE